MVFGQLVMPVQCCAEARRRRLPQHSSAQASPSGCMAKWRPSFVMVEFEHCPQHWRDVCVWFLRCAHIMQSRCSLRGEAIFTNPCKKWFGKENTLRHFCSLITPFSKTRLRSQREDNRWLGRQQMVEGSTDG